MKHRLLRLFLILAGLSFLVTPLLAQEKFDIVSFQAPSGWQKSVEPGAVQFTKREGNAEAILMLFKSLPTSKDSRATFDASWDSIVKALFDKSDAPRMQPPGNLNGWTIENGAAVVEKAGSKAVASLMSATGGGKAVNLLIITNNASFQPAIDAFVASIALPKVAPTSATRSNAGSNSPARGSQNSALAGRIWEGKTSEKLPNGNLSGGFWSRQYRFFPDGTYRFVYVGASAYSQANLLQYESGTYSVNGDQLTISPTSGANEEWSTVGGQISISGMSDAGIRRIKESWGKRIKSEKRNLEQKTYRISIEYWEGNAANALKLEYAGGKTEREGNGDFKFYLDTAPERSVKLPNGMK